MQTLSTDAFVSTHGGFNQSPFAIAGRCLPFQPAVYMHGGNVVVALAERLGAGPFNRVRAWWNDNSCGCAVTQNCVVGSIGSKLVDLIIDLIQQRCQLRGSAALLICQAMGNDLATVGVYRQVQLAPTAAGLCPMLFFQPLARAIDLQPGAVAPEREGARLPNVCAACGINQAIFDPGRIDTKR